jgi:hypothetical protein
MQRFFVTPVLDHGRQYWLANYPSDKEPWSRRARGRKQKKFTSKAAAEAFLAEAQREFIRKGGVSLANDRDLHYDFIRAAELIADIPGGRLETAAHLLKMCRSSREMRGGRYEAPRNRQVELDPRPFLACQNEARRCGVTVAEMANRMILMWLEWQASARVREREETEAREALEARRRSMREYQRANYKPKAVREQEAIDRMFAEIEEQHATRMTRESDGNRRNSSFQRRTG